jgi:Rod binding domain-containing protein
MSSFYSGAAGLANPFAVHDAAAQVAPPNSTPQTRKLYKECQQFEGVLIANLWDEMDQGVSMTDFGSDPGASTMEGLGIESAANSVATSGGLGIARILYDSLAPRLRVESSQNNKDAPEPLKFSYT